MTQDSFGATGPSRSRKDPQDRPASRPSKRTASTWIVCRSPCRILLENLVRYEDGSSVTRGDIEALAGWDPAKLEEREIAFRPARVLMQDFTGVPAVVDLAAMRDAMVALGGDPKKISPLPTRRDGDRPLGASRCVRQPRSPCASTESPNSERNSERYSFLKWGRGRWRTRVVPAGNRHRAPGQHRIPRARRHAGTDGYAYPDTVVGTCPIATRPWSTAWACSAGVWAVSKPKRLCWASRCRC
ncbi:MAG: aconitase family protein [Planctomycetota bacterium]